MLNRLKKIQITLLLITQILITQALITQTISAEYKNFVFTINSYNNAQFCERNLYSALDQDYPIEHYRIVLTCDCCTDNTFELVTNLVNQHPKKQLVKIINNPKRKGAMRNFYEVITNCLPQEIIINLDGDDFMADNQVLTYLNQIYADPNIWLTYGSYKFYPEKCKFKSGVKAYPKQIIAQGDFRKLDFVATHLRTYYAWLFQKIDPQDFKDCNNNFFEVACDLAIMYPMLEMAREHHKFITKILYIYNVSSPLSDTKTKLELVHKTTTEINQRPKYSPLIDQINI
jgi:hypothetical protein